MSKMVCGSWNGKMCRLLMLGLVLGASCKNADQQGPTAGAARVVATKSGIDMVRIPSGQFRMGSSSGKSDEAPIHEVHMDSFLMDRCEMTQEQYAKFVAINGSHFKGPKNPVEMISWPEAALFCNMRSRAEGLKPCYDEETGRCNFDADGEGYEAAIALVAAGVVCFLRLVEPALSAVAAVRDNDGLPSGRGHVAATGSCLGWW